MEKYLFYKTGVDKSSCKSMFNYLKNHFMYNTMNSWNGERSIANNVKLYNLKLDGDWCVAYDFLLKDNYFEINSMIEDFEIEHEGYSLGFNGRSGGYIVLYNDNNMNNILPKSIIDSKDYDDFKNYCKEYYGNVYECKDMLKEKTKLVQDFDKFCDELRQYVNNLSQSDFKTYLLENAINNFNLDYEHDLKKLKMKQLNLNKDKKINIKEINQLDVLISTLYSYLNDASNYDLKIKKDNNCLWIE